MNKPYPQRVSFAFRHGNLEEIKAHIDNHWKVALGRADDLRNTEHPLSRKDAIRVLKGAFVEIVELTISKEYRKAIYTFNEKQDHTELLAIRLFSLGSGKVEILFAWQERAENFTQYLIWDLCATFETPLPNGICQTTFEKDTLYTGEFKGEPLRAIAVIKSYLRSNSRKFELFNPNREPIPYNRGVPDQYGGGIQVFLSGEKQNHSYGIVIGILSHGTSSLVMRWTPVMGISVEEIQADAGKLFNYLKAKGWIETTIADIPHQEQTDRPLTNREEEVATLLAQGLSDLEIASQLMISPKTVPRYRQSIKRKWNAPSQNIGVLRIEALRRKYGQGM